MKFHRSFAVFIALPVLFAGCGDDDDDLEFVLTTPVEVAASAASVEAFADVPFEFSDGSIFGSEFAGAAATVTFTSASTYTISSAGGDVSGTVTFGSCIFSNPGLNLDPCEFQISNAGARFVAGLVVSEATSDGFSTRLVNQGNNVCRLEVNGEILVVDIPCAPATGTGTGTGIFGVVGPNVD